MGLFNWHGSMKGNRNAAHRPKGKGLPSSVMKVEFAENEGIYFVPRHRPHEARPRNDGYDQDRLDAARRKRQDRAARNRILKVQGGFR